MKLFSKIVFIAIIILQGLACEALKDLASIDFKADFSVAYFVELDANDSELEATESFSLTDDSEVEKYKEKLEEIELDSVAIKIENLVGGSNVILNGNLKYSKIAETSGTIFANINNLNISALATSGQEQKLDVEVSEVNNITNLLEQEKEIKIYVSGTVSEVPLVCNIILVFYTTVTAEALD